jgi:hypothetical protein
MGKKSRERRKDEKVRVRALEKRTAFVYKYKTFERGADGELKAPQMTKAEHRRRWVRAVEMRMEAEIAIVDALCKQAHDEICAIEDACVFGDLNRAAEGYDAGADAPG